jgi:hypothetical protein
MVEYDNSYRIMIVGVDNVSHHILGHGMGIGQDADLRPQVKVVKFSSRWRLLIITQIVNKCEDNCWKI